MHVWSKIFEGSNENIFDKKFYTRRYLYERNIFDLINNNYNAFAVTFSIALTSIRWRPVD